MNATYVELLSGKRYVRRRVVIYHGVYNLDQRYTFSGSYSIATHISGEFLAGKTYSRVITEMLRNKKQPQLGIRCKRSGATMPMTIAQCIV